MIEGKLVNLRALEAGDLDTNARWFNDPEVTEHLTARYPISHAAEEEWFKQRMSSMMTFDSAFFAIETKDGEYIGNISFLYAFTENRKAHLGITIGEKAYWSKGYGTDAMLTFLRFGFDEMNLHRVDLTVDEDNPRAIACYRKCGFVQEGRMRQARYTRGRYIDWVVMGILRDEFYAQHREA